MKPLTPSTSGVPTVLQATDCLEIPSGQIVTDSKTIIIDNLTLAGDLSDVNLSSVSDGQVLLYDSNLAKWVNGTVTTSGGSSTFLELNDTAGSYANPGDLVKINDSGDGLDFITPNYLKNDSSVPLVADFDFSSFKGVNLANPVNNTDAVNLCTVNNCINSAVTNLSAVDSNLQNQIDDANNCISSLNTCTNNLQTQVTDITTNGVNCAQDANTLDGLDSTCFASANHNHDDRYYTQDCLNNGVLDNRYYTENETDAALSGKADTNHTHVWSDVSKTGSVLSDIGNVSNSGLTGGCVLCYDSGSSQWIPGTISSGTPAEAFIDLTDVDTGNSPASYSGLASHYLRVNAGETGLEFLATLDADTLNGSCVNDSLIDSSSLWSSQKIENEIQSRINGLHWQEPFVDFNDLTTSGLAANNNDRYVATTTGTSNSGNIYHSDSTVDTNVTANNIYQWDALNSYWIETAVSEGEAARNLTDNINYTFNGTSWVDFSEVVNHNSLSGLQGGNGTNEFYHLTSNDKITLTSGAISDASALHNHNTCYYTKAESDAALANKSDVGHTHTWTEVSKTGSKLSDIDNVDITNINDNYMLYYDSANTCWYVGAAPSGGGNSLPDGSATNTHIEWDGSNWVPVSTKTFSGSGVTTTISNRANVTDHAICIYEDSTSCARGLLYICSDSNSSTDSTGMCVVTKRESAVFLSDNTDTGAVLITTNSTNTCTAGLFVEGGTMSAICSHTIGDKGLIVCHEPNSGGDAGIWNETSTTAAYGIYTKGGVKGVMSCGSDQDFYAGGSGVVYATSYTPFTGSHITKIVNDDLSIEKGQVVSIADTIQTNDFSNTLPVVEVSSKACDPAALGVFVKYKDYSNMENEDNWAFKDYDMRISGIINAVGEGNMLVTDEGGDIAIGDFLTTSNRPGLAMRQNDDNGNRDSLHRNYTLAKATMSVNWNDVEVNENLGYKAKLISVIYLAG